MADNDIDSVFNKRFLFYKPNPKQASFQSAVINEH